jgi:hypothetical protein
MTDGDAGGDRDAVEDDDSDPPSVFTNSNGEALDGNHDSEAVDDGDGGALDDNRDGEALDDDHDDGDADAAGGDVGAATVGDRGPDASERSGREPLGDLREQVVDDEGARTPGASFPEGVSATGGGNDDRENDETAGSDSENGSTSGSGSTDAGADPTVPEAGRDGPLGDLAAGVDGRRERSAKTDEELFDEVEVGEVDADELWSQVETDAPTVEPRGEREIREVEKRKYCSQCPYFSEPPEVGCSHDGTDILQQVDMEHFEVADCPVVLEDERLEDVTSE